MDDDGNVSEPVPMDSVDAELAESTRKAMAEELADFLAYIEPIAEQEDWDNWPSDEQIAHDFWLTRNGHGVGFWDRGLGKLGDLLTDAAKTYGSADLYIGDDGLIYQM